MKKMVILGAAESGVGAAILAQQKGYEVWVSEYGTIKPKYKAQLDAHHIAWEEGGHTPEKILTADEVVKSPGIPEEAPMVCALRERGIPVISEIELAGRYTQAKTICITGSNGKTTTTSLIYHILQKAGYQVGLAGNIGRSFALQVAEGEKDWYVLELSSFQLDDMYDFHAHIAVLLNITPDHLDRYGFEMQRYVDAKMRILQNMTSEDCLIYWSGDEYVPKELEKRPTPAVCYPFSDAPTATSAACIDGEALTVKAPTAFAMPTEDLGIAGLHNQRNALAAALAALSAQVPIEVLRESLADFPGVEHRLEKVAKVEGIQYINDSKATNVDACYWALAAMRTPTVLIIGGKDKGNDYAQIADLVKEKCRALVFLGADNAKLHEFFGKMNVPIADTHSMKDCVTACRHFAQSGDTVLLSPCCASFDLFKNMEDRGEQFKAAVRAMISTQN